MKTKEQIRRIDKVPNAAKKTITKELEGIIKRNGFSETRLVISKYFINYRMSLKNKAKIAELKKEIASLKR